MNTKIAFYSDDFFIDFVKVIDGCFDLCKDQNISYSFDSKFFGGDVSITCDILVLNRGFDIREFSVLCKKVIIYKGVNKTLEEIKNAIKEM